MRTILGFSVLALLVSSLSGCGDQAKPDPAALAATATSTAVASATPSAAPTVSAVPSATVAAEGSAAPTADASAAPSGSPSVASSAKGAPSAAPSSSAKADSGGEVKGTESTGAAFSAYMSGAKSYKVGQPGTVTAIVNALGEYHVNPEFPYKVKLGAAPAGVSYAQEVITDVSRSEKRATMSIPFTPSQAGSATITGTISLSVCTKDQCVIEKAPVSVTVKVD